MEGLVLSTFPGLDLLGAAFETEGFCVVRGPDALLGGDARNFHPPAGRFDGVIGGPPCQAFSLARNGNGEAKQPDLIPEFTRIVLEAKPAWWLMENVPQAPEPELSPRHSFVLNAHEFGAAQTRWRRFTSNLDLKAGLSREVLPPEKRHPDPWPPVTASEWRTGNGHPSIFRTAGGRKYGRRMSLREVNDAMGLPADFATPALLATVSYEVRGNGVPIAMGRALARAIRWTLLPEALRRPSAPPSMVRERRAKHEVDPDEVAADPLDEETPLPEERFVNS